MSASRWQEEQTQQVERKQKETEPGAGWCPSSGGYGRMETTVNGEKGAETGQTQKRQTKSETGNEQTANDRRRQATKISSDDGKLSSSLETIFTQWSTVQKSLHIRNCGKK